MAINITISHDPINEPATKTATINNIAANTSRNRLGVITTPDSNTGYQRGPEIVRGVVSIYRNMKQSNKITKGVGVHATNYNLVSERK